MEDYESVRNHLKKKISTGKLTPMLQEFLLIHGKRNISVSDMTKFIDEKQQYKNRLTVSSIKWKIVKWKMICQF